MRRPGRFAQSRAPYRSLPHSLRASGLSSTTRQRGRATGYRAPCAPCLPSRMSCVCQATSAASPHWSQAPPTLLLLSSSWLLYRRSGFKCRVTQCAKQACCSRLASHLAISKLPTLGAAQLTWSWRGQRYLDGKASDSKRKDGLCSRQGAARRSLPAPSAWPPTSCSRLWAQTAAPSNGRSTPPSLRCLHRLLRSPCRMSRTSAS